MTDPIFKHFEQQTSSPLCSVLYLVHPKSSSICQSRDRLKSDTTAARKKQHKAKTKNKKPLNKKNKKQKTKNAFRSGLPICHEL